MKKLLIALVFPICVMAQQNFDTTKWSILVGVSPDYAYRYLHVDEDKKEEFVVDGYTYLNNDFFRDTRNKYEKPFLSYSLFTGFAYKIKPKSTFEARIMYARRGEKIVRTDSAYISQLSNNPLSKVNFYLNYHFIDLPLLINYYWTIKQNKVSTYIGLMPSLFLNYNTYRILYSRESRKKENYTSSYESERIRRKFNLYLLSGIGVERKLTKQIDIMIRPEFRFALTTIDRKYPIEEYLYSAGLIIGIKYRLL